MVFAICMAIWNVVYCLRMCMLDNKLQTFFNLVLFQQLCGREVLWNWFSFLLHVSDWNGMFVDDVKFVFQQQLHGRFFTGTWMTLLSEFDAPARCTSTRRIKARQHGTAADR